MSLLSRRRLKLIVLTAAVGLIALAFVEGLHWWRHVTVTSSWIDADFTEMGSGVNGRIERIEVRKGDAVRTGDILATMDSEIAALDVVAIEADLAKARAEKIKVEAELGAFQRDVRDRTQTLQAVLDLQARELETLRRRLSLANATVERNAKLVSRQTISRQTDENARDRLLDVTSDLRALETQMAEKRRKIAELQGSTAEEAIFQSRIVVIEREIDKLSVGLRQAKRSLAKMHIYAPIDGVVNEVYVNAGAYVEDGDRVMLLHDPKKLWIEAPVDDSEIRHIRVGQPVEIDIEPYPYDTFVGTVAAVSQVTIGAIKGEGQSDRASPRIPVHIDLAPTDRPLWPGARATVSIRIR